jgi:multiple sugar transport system substrate-binding protein
MKRRGIVICVITTVLLLVSFLAFSAGEQEQPATEEGSFEGVTLNYLCNQNPYIQDGLLKWKGEFEARTGMKVEFDMLPEKAFRNKLTLYMASQDGSYDIVNGNIRDFGKMVSGKWVVPLNDFIADPKWTESEWDPDDFTALDKYQSDDGKLWAIPWHDVTNILSYNKRLYRNAGIMNPPDTFDELMSNAAKIHQPDKDEYGIVLRATREGAANGYSWIMIWLANGGGWHKEGRKPYAVLDTEEAIQTTEFWVEILGKYGAPGVSGFNWPDCQAMMLQDFAGHWIDGTPIVAQLLNPEKSKIVDHVGFHVIEGRGDKYTVGGGWGIWIPTTAQNQRASWEFMKWATSKEVMIKEVQEVYWASVPRASALTSDIYKEQFNEEFARATVKAMAAAIREYSPMIAQGPQIRDTLAIALQKALTGQATSREAMEEANRKVVELLTETGFYSN